MKISLAPTVERIPRLVNGLESTIILNCSGSLSTHHTTPNKLSIVGPGRSVGNSESYLHIALQT